MSARQDFDQGHAPLWDLDPRIRFLNHGSFGATPRTVLEAQQRYRQQLEHEPVRFFVRELPELAAQARAALGRFVGADADDLTFVSNATSGVNTVLRSLEFAPGDELLVTDHEYGACRNALDFVADRWGARTVVVPIPFPVESPAQVTQAIVARVTDRTRLALVDHITSPTALVLPIGDIVQQLQQRGIDTLVDGAHAVGMVPLDLDGLGAAYYTSNCHKWLCTPKGSALLHVRRDRQAAVRPLTISFGATEPTATRYRAEFDWMGTGDPTAFLCIPDAIRELGSVLPGGWEQLQQRNRRLALRARRLLCRTLGVAPPCPESMIGAMATVQLPDGSKSSVSWHLATDPLQDALFEQHGVEVPIIPWPAPPGRLIRVSAQLYNGFEDYLSLASALEQQLGLEPSPARES